MVDLVKKEHVQIVHIRARQDSIEAPVGFEM